MAVDINICIESLIENSVVDALNTISTRPLFFVEANSQNPIVRFARKLMEWNPPLVY